MKSLIIILLLTLFSIECKEQNSSINLQYGDPHLWYNDANKLGDKGFDVFYLLPTCVWDRIDTNGDTLHYADPLLVSDREAMQPSFELAEQIFGKDANFYAPYYRQLALQSWCSDSLIDLRFPYAFEDVKGAFDYYMKNINSGHPFVLAGFSQGGKCVVELMKTLNSEQCRKLVAAYVIGYKVTASDTLNYKQIKPATNEKDVGVTICYNSVATTDAICRVLTPNAVSINPVNWSTNTEQATLNDSVTIHLNNQHNVLIVDGFNPDNYYHSSLDFLFKKGNYHLQELDFYKNNLAKNVTIRFQTFNSKSQSIHD